MGSRTDNTSRVLLRLCSVYNLNTPNCNVSSSILMGHVTAFMGPPFLLA